MTICSNVAFLGCSPKVTVTRVTQLTFPQANDVPALTNQRSWNRDVSVVNDKFMLSVGKGALAASRAIALLVI